MTEIEVANLAQLGRISAVILNLSPRSEKEISVMDDGNVFNLNNPDGLFCDVARYSTGFGTLALRVDQEVGDEGQHEFLCWIYFNNVGYFQGPLRWKGANFFIASSEEDLRLRYQLGYHLYLKEEMILQIGKLYKVKHNTPWLDVSLEIKILASMATVSYDPGIDKPQV
jgi:hypothetical protein